jgi:hypothetical protein
MSSKFLNCSAQRRRSSQDQGNRTVSAATQTHGAYAVGVATVREDVPREDTPGALSVCVRNTGQASFTEHTGHALALLGFAHRLLHHDGTDMSGAHGGTL